MKKTRIFVIVAALLVLCMSLWSCEDDVAFSGNDSIGADKAKELAVKHFGLEADDCSGFHIEYDDGHYEIEFFCDGKEYEADVDSKTGDVREIDVEGNGHPGANGTTDSPAISDTVADKPETSDETAADRIGESEAKSIALGHFGFSESDCDYIHAEYDDGEWKVEFFCDGKEYEAEVGGISGTVHETDVDLGAPSTETASTMPPSETQEDEMISLEIAKEIACEHFGVDIGSCTFTSARLDGREYEIEFVLDGIEYEAEVNAYTAKVTDSDVDRD